MRKNLTKIMLSAAVLIGTSARAQHLVANYTFAQSSGTYVAISGGTLLGSSTTNNQTFVDPTITIGSGVGANGPGLSIGFTYTFNGVPYDKVGINANGWLTFGQSSLTPAVDINSSSSYSAVSATSSASANQQQRIVALGLDIRAQTGSSLRIETIGSAPNQTCVIQWTDYRIIAGSGDTVNFQIRLLETSNIAEVVYGKVKITSAFGYTAQVGLRGKSNSDFNMRMVNNTIGWNNSSTGLTNISGAYFNSTYAPAIGLSYKWYPPPPCTTVAATAAVSQFSLICPNRGVSKLSLATTYTNPGHTFQWYSSTVSANGPYQAVGGATLANALADTLLSQTWYQAVLTCTISLNTVTSSPISVQVVGTTTSNVPYFEGFENIFIPDGLPNCSWMSTSPGTTCLTYTSTLYTDGRMPNSGNNYAAFRNEVGASANYFFSNGIQLEPGITYSAGVYYINDGGDDWLDFSLMLGSSQAVSSLSTIATISPSGLFYKLLSNTFTVATSGIYYLGLKALDSNFGDYLSFDDLFITAPCALNPVSVNVSAVNYTICSGKSTTLTASGANSYNWGWVAPTTTGNSIVVSPQASMSYTVTGTNSLTGCQNAAFVNIVVNPTPYATIFSPNSSVCSGSSVTLYGKGNGQFSWSNGSNSPSIVVSPQVNTTYTLNVASNQGGCISSATQAITVNTPAPVFAQISTGSAICVGETTQLIGLGTGIVSFEWRSDNITILSNTAQVSPLTSTTYTLVGTDVNGCTSTQTVQLLVNPCTGIAENSGNNSLLVYPNPTDGQFIISTGNTRVKNIVVTDITGRLITSISSGAETVELNLEGFAKGLYYAKILTNKENNVVKIMKE